MKIIAMLVAAGVLVFAGCATTQPIHNVQNAPIILAPGKKSATMNQVSGAIMRAGTKLGWQMNPVAPGRLGGRLMLRSHVALIDVEHDTKTYSIKYRDSSNLDAKDGMIHRNYNGWIENLDKNIRAELAAL
ncbi:MAG TPA: hypothetical protein VFB93_10850 [Burkholderiales bacterium]|nr:hypothetical protein [Burkholderiales bacterium]